MKHPATYSDILIPVLAGLLQYYRIESVLDPMAGIGKIGLVRAYGYEGEIVTTEIEPEWAYDQTYASYIDQQRCMDARDIQSAIKFDAICTSPPYGNRLADKIGGDRVTYYGYLGRELQEGNAGALQWGSGYQDLMAEIWEACVQNVHPKGYILLNISDHIRGGVVMEVTTWHTATLESLGLKVVQNIKVETPRMRWGANREARVPYEGIVVFRRS